MSANANVLEQIIVTGGRPRDGFFSVPTNPEFVQVSLGAGGQYGFLDLPAYMQLVRTDEAREIVGKTAKAIAAVIKAVVDAARPFLNSREEARLDALYNTLNAAGEALVAGSMDWDTGLAAINSAFRVCIDLAGGKVVGVIFSAIGLFAATNAPVPPHVKGIITGASGLTGYAIGEWMSNKYTDEIASWLTAGIMYGAEALAWLIYNMTEIVKVGGNPANWTMDDGVPARPNIDVSGLTEDWTFYLQGGDYVVT